VWISYSSTKGRILPMPGFIHSRPQARGSCSVAC
jgi:hypothetical protein